LTITYRDDASPSREDLVSLYDSVGWSAYTDDPERLSRAVSASLRVVTAWDDEQLVGLARVVGDGLTIVYLQDILVAPRLQRAGLGRELVARVLEPFHDVRQKVLLTDDEPGQLAFYACLGFTRVQDLEYPLNAFVRLG